MLTCQEIIDKLTDENIISAIDEDIFMTYHQGISRVALVERLKKFDFEKAMIAAKKWDDGIRD